MNRRQFIKTITTGAMAAFLEFNSFVVKRTMAANYIGLHPFIEAHPEAVFVKRTSVSSKMDSDAKLQEGSDLAKEIFTLKESPGIKVSQPLAIKPNLTCANGRSNTEDGMGIITDPYFVKGMTDGMMDFGVSGDNIYIREGNWLGDSYCPNECLTSPYVDLLSDMVHVTDFPTGRNASQLNLNDMQEGTEVIWKDCPNGIVFRRIGYVAPFNHKDSWLLNIAKFKCHTMGMTLSAKNLQGMCVHPYIHFCEGVGGVQSHPADVLRDFQPNFDRNVDELHSRHLSEGVPRWDKPGTSVDSGYPKFIF